MDECTIEISTVYASPGPEAGSVTLQWIPEAMGLWAFV